AGVLLAKTAPRRGHTQRIVLLFGGAVNKFGFARNNGSMAAYSAGTPSPRLAKGGGQTGPNAIPLVPISPSFQQTRAELMYSPDVSSVRAHQAHRAAVRLARV